ncbi:MAG: hypothetical protein HQL82_10750 [Magnetococcales bacterium]|nr:hypothetical protein [Magnetococcales bacterium]
MADSMRQQVDFYQESFRPKRDPLDAQRLAIYLMLLIFLFSMAIAAMGWQKGVTERRLADLKTLEASKSALVQDLNRRFPAPKRSAALGEEVKRLKGQLKRLEKGVVVLDLNKTGNFRGFTPFLAALGREKVPGVWLEGLELIGGGRAVKLIGKTRDPALVPAFIVSLTRQSLFAGLAFTLLDLSQEKPKEPDEKAAPKALGGLPVVAPPVVISPVGAGVASVPAEPPLMVFVLVSRGGEHLFSGNRAAREGGSSQQQRLEQATTTSDAMRAPFDNVKKQMNEN